MRYIIGFLLIIVGGVLTAVTEIMLFVPILFVGVFLFASFQTSNNLCDYILANTKIALVRVRHYWIFLPFAIVAYVLTLGRSALLIPWKQEYFLVTLDADENLTPEKITRKEYITLRNRQRMLYSTQILSKEFMESTYTLEDIGLKHKKVRLILAGIFAGLTLTMLTEPNGGLWLALLFEAVFMPMLFLWIPEYQDAKILQQAYDRATKSHHL